jgi:hypothetical protein
MSSGKGSDITERDAADLLHKLITESMKVQVVFTGPDRVAAGLVGLVTADRDGLVWVKQGVREDEPFFRFDARIAASFKYADERVFPPLRRDTETPSLKSALIFIYADGSQVGLYELATEDRE